MKNETMRTVTLVLAQDTIDRIRALIPRSGVYRSIAEGASSEMTDERMVSALLFLALNQEEDYFANLEKRFPSLVPLPSSGNPPYRVPDPGASNGIEAPCAGEPISTLGAGGDADEPSPNDGGGRPKD